ncbi:MAG TPA: hypothetical protein VFC37_01375 [Terracidiphilus sp.]|jgi:hypothetical protein|nr:hypothetical protein [Terracidiphilus sp.]
MRKLSPFVLGLSIAVAGSALAAVAQETPSHTKVLQITREYTKPYKNGMAHDKTESAFIQAMTKAKFPAYYVGLTSMSGKSRSLFLTRYDSFADWEKDNKIVDKNPSLNAELERDSVADGELLESVDSLVYTYDEDLSYKPRPDLSHAHFMEISVFHVRPGHRAEWLKLGKIVKDAHDKAGTSAHWSMFEMAYGAQEGEYVALSADNSMADIDTGYSEEKKFMDALGENGVKQFRELLASAVDYSRSELFSINPKMSYVSDEWIKADPDFWKPKPAAAPAAKAAAAEKKP